MPRLRRRAFWFAMLLLWLLFFVGREMLGLAQAPTGATAWAALMLLGLTALAVGRLHDRGRGALALLALVIPIAGALWLFWELALRPGRAGTNRFGPDPKTKSDPR